MTAVAELGLPCFRSVATALEGSGRALSSPDADPAQIAFSRDGRTLAVTERGTDSISTFAVGPEGYAEGPARIRSSGKTPYGFDFTRDGAMIVTEAFGGAMGKAAASSYALAGSSLSAVSGSVGDTRSEVSWAVVTADGRFAYVTNFGDGTISSYEIAGDGRLRLRDAVAASTRLGEKGVRDEALARDGRHLYAIDADSRQLFGWAIGADGELGVGRRPARRAGRRHLLSPRVATAGRAGRMIRGRGESR